MEERVLDALRRKGARTLLELALLDLLVKTDELRPVLSALVERGQVKVFRRRGMRSAAYYLNPTYTPG